MTASEYYDLLREKHAQTDWSSLESIRAYNEYARRLRSSMEAERDADFDTSRISQHPRKQNALRNAPDA